MSFKTMSRNNPQKSLGDLMKNLETPGKTGRVGRYANKNMWLKVMLVFKNLDATYDLLLGKKGRKLDRKGRPQLFIAHLQTNPHGNLSIKITDKLHLVTQNFPEKSGKWSVCEKILTLCDEFAQINTFHQKFQRCKSTLTRSR